jgi:DNA replication protein DnaD
MIQPVGYIKLHRELLTKPIWLNSTNKQKVILITLLMMANFRENDWDWNGERFRVAPGQIITSLESISKNCGNDVSVQNVRTALTRFVALGFLTNKSTNKNRLITITNWELYQQDVVSTNKQSDKQLTSNQQATNKQLTTKEESKESKKVKEGNNVYMVIDSLVLTIEDYDKLVGWFGKANVDSKIEYIQNKPDIKKKYKSIYLTLLNWLKKDNPTIDTSGGVKKEKTELKFIEYDLFGKESNK